MVASRSARERKAAAQAGPLARVKIDLDGEQQFLYRISCTSCLARGDRAWSTHRSGADNGFMAAMDRWIFHLVEKHPGEAARDAEPVGEAGADTGDDPPAARTYEE